MHDTLGNLEPLIAPQLKARNLTYIYNPADGGLIAYGNRARVEQIVLNLLSNAIKYGLDPGQLRVSAGRTAAGEVALSVWNAGVGMTVFAQSMLNRRLHASA